METAAKNLFIVDDNLLWTTSLKNYLKQQFGPQTKVSTFGDGESCLRKLDEHPDVILMDYQFEGLPDAKNGIDFLKEIKKSSPETTVFLVSSKKNHTVESNSILFGAKEYINKEDGSWNKVFVHISGSIDKLYVRMMEFSVPKYLLMIFTSFAAVGIAVYFADKYFF